jgi:phage tail sheath gpL-like
MITLNSIPLDIRTPGQFIEIDATNADRSLRGRPHKVVLIGQKRTAGSADAGKLVEVTSVNRAVQLFGQGSVLARMFAAFKANDEISETWAIPLADVGGGAAALGSLTMTGAPTEAGTLSLLIAGKSVPVPVAAAASLSSIATAVAAAVNKNRDLPVTAAVDGVDLTKVNLTARHKGTLGNKIDLRHSYFRGEKLPAGLGVTIADMAGGATDPDVSGVFAEIGDEDFSDIIWPYTDSTSLGTLEAALTNRWSPMKMLDGNAYSAAAGTYGALSALCAARNSPYVSIVGLRGSPTPPEEIAAAYGATVGYAGAIDPARPFQTLGLTGVLAPIPGVRFTREERDLLLRDGVSTTVTSRDGTVRIERAVTTYKLSPEGVDDLSLYSVNAILLLSYMRWSLRTRIARKFGRMKLADDGGFAGRRAKTTVTPKRIRGEIIGWYRDLCGKGLAEDPDKFARKVRVERDRDDPDRVNAMIPPDLMNGMLIFAAQLRFKL